MFAVHPGVEKFQDKAKQEEKADYKGRGNKRDGIIIWTVMALFTPELSPKPFTLQAPHQPGQPGFKFTVAESCDRIKDEFQFLQAQYHR